MAKGKWERFTVYKVDANGMQRLISDDDQRFFQDDRNYRYLPAGLPGDPKPGERVAIFIVRGQPYQRCVVGEQEYRVVSDSRGWRLYWEPLAKVN